MAKEQETYTPRHCEGHDCRVEPNYGDWDVDLCALHASAPTLLAQRDALLAAAEVIADWHGPDAHQETCDALQGGKCFCIYGNLRAAVQAAKGGAE